MAKILKKLYSSELPRVNETKYLEITFEPNMRYDRHAENLISSAKYLIFIFRKSAKLWKLVL